MRSRTALVSLGDRDDPLRHGRGEQHGLTVVGRALENRLDVVGETHVEHLVGFVEDHGVDRIEGERPAPDVVERSPGRGDDDVRTAVERLELPPDRLTAEDRHDLDTQLAAVLEHGLAHLHRELAGRNEYEHLRHAT